jgi:hypothetical protein
LALLIAEHLEHRWIGDGRFQKPFLQVSSQPIPSKSLKIETRAYGLLENWLDG